MAHKTKVSQAEGRNSLRTTVPAGIANILDIKKGDYLLWTVKIRDNDFLVELKKE